MALRVRLPSLNKTSIVLPAVQPRLRPTATAALARFYRIALVVLASWWVSSCTCTNKRAGRAASLLISEIQSGLAPLEATRAAPPTPTQRAFLDYYRIHTAANAVQFGTFKSGPQSLAAYLFHPPRPSRGTVMVVHGYLDHVGRAWSLINRLTADGYTVAVYDQPGHGLSGGRRVSVRDFSVYQTAFTSFLRVVRSELPPPYHVVAHSLGGTVIAEHLLLTETTPLHRAILLAPVVRDALPGPIQFLGRAVSPVIDYVPRVSLGSSTDPLYEEHVKNDPLRFRCVSTRWTRALYRWRLEMEAVPPSARTLLILSAEFDTVTDNAFSNRWLARAFPNARFETITGARHHLLNEAGPIRAGVLDRITAELRSPRHPNP